MLMSGAWLLNWTQKRKRSFGKALKTRVFKKENWINVSLSLSQNTLCNIRSCRTEYIIYSHHHLRPEWKTVETPALVDSGTGGKFINQNFAQNSKMDIYNLEKPMKALNINGTENKQGTIKQYVDLTFTINGQPQTQRLFLTGLRKQKIILGFPWLQEQNPIINWKTGEFCWPIRVPDMKKIRRLTEQQWKNKQETKELKKISTENSERSLRQWKKKKKKGN